MKGKTVLPLLLTAFLVGNPAPATNTVCPVMGGKVTPGKSPSVVVRGRSYLLCCNGCDAKLKANPDQYLEKDGSLKKKK